MERGEGSNQVPDLNKQIIDATPLSIIPPIFVVEPLRMLLPAADEPNTNDGSPSEMVRAFTSIIAFNNYSPAVAAAAADAGPSHAPVKRGRGRPRGSKNLNTKKKLKLKNTERLIPSVPYVLGDISQRDQETGNSDLVCKLMMRFDAVRRRLRQADIIRCEITAAFATFKKLQLQTNTKKRVGSVPGVNIGDIFYLWGEMGLVGLHSAPIGAEFLEVKDSGLDKLVAVSVVSSGKNADEAEDPNVLTFTGFGGTDKFRGHASDQSLDHMNLSLVTAMKFKSVVRVVRSKKDKTRTSGKIYIYDGLYMIVNMWEEIGANGFKVFKFKLTREADQKPAFELWKSVEQWRYGLITRPGLVLQDLSNGAENLKVCVVNEVDNEQGPALFTYVTSLKHPVLKLQRSLVECCTCQTRSCSENCVCVSRNLDRLPYVEGALVTRGMIVYECGGSCSCSLVCKNKMIHTGLKFSFEVFKTVDCGWGLRSWDPIRAGSFICELAGDIIQNGDDEEDAYIFDTSRVYKPFTWNYEPELVGEDAAERVSETLDCSSRFVISAKKSGNVARFMNHSCSPNVFWQMIAREHDGLWCMHVAFFAMKHIPPLTELRYDYGASRGDVTKKKCLCRSQKCTGSFG